MIQKRNPGIAQITFQALDQGSAGSPFEQIRECRNILEIEGFHILPTWQEIARGIRPPEPEDADIGEWSHGWQFYAARSRENFHRENVILGNFSRSHQALLRSQSGPGAGSAFTVIPTSHLFEFSAQCFKIILLRRLRLALPIFLRRCRCAIALDSLGDHRASCPRAGILGNRGFALEAAATRIVREAGARVSTNIFLRDLNLDIPPEDARRLEVVANNLPLWNGTQLAIDTTLVSTLRSNGTPIPHSHTRDGVALTRARRRKERTYPELSQLQDRVRLVVLALETGGRFSQEAIDFIHQLAKAKARTTPESLRNSVALDWFRRWISLLACAAQRAFALSLLDQPPSHGYALDGYCPFLGDMLADDRWSSGPHLSRVQ